MEKLIFDLDGTLWDTKDSYLYAYDKLVKEFNISPRLPDEKILEYMGIRLDLLLDGLFKGLDNLEEIGKRAVYYSIEYVINHPKLFSKDMKSLFNKLSQNYELYIISNCPEAYLDTFINISGVRKYLKNYFTLDDGEKDKHLELITNNYTDKALFIGDSPFDYESIKNHSKIYFIYAKYGYIKTDTYDYHIDNLDDIEIVLNKINKKERMIDGMNYQIFSKNDTNLTLMDNDGKLEFGFMEIADYTDFREVLKRLKSFLGNRDVIGPINAKTWYSYRISLDSFDFRLFPDSINDLEVLNILKDEGFKVFQTYSSNLAYIDERIERAAFRTRIDDSYKIIKIHGSECYGYINELYDISKRVFERADYYKDISLNDFKDIYLEGLDSINPDLILVYIHNKLVAFHFGYNDPLNRFYVSKTIGVDPLNRNTKAMMILAKELILTTRGYGHDKILYHFQNDRTGTASNAYKHYLIKKKTFGLLRYSYEG